MSIKIVSKPVPISNSVCSDCSVSAVCKYKDTMNEIREKLIDMTTRDDEGHAEIDLNVHFDLFLGCTYYKPNINIQTVPEVDLYPLINKEPCRTTYTDRTTPIDLGKE